MSPPNGARDTASRRLLRRVPHGKYDLGPPLVIQLTAFLPTTDDTDGLSVYLADAVQIEAVAAAARNPATTLVVRVDEAALLLEGLGIVPDERDDDLPGHSLIPGLKRAVYEANKRPIKEIAERLARAATKSIVFIPPEIQAKIQPRGPT